MNNPNLSANFINELSNLLYSKDWIQLEPTECANTLFLTKQALAKHDKESEQYPPTESDMLQWVLTERIAQLNADKTAKQIEQYGVEKTEPQQSQSQTLTVFMQEQKPQQQITIPKPIEEKKIASPQLEKLLTDYKSVLYNYNIDRKEKRTKLHDLESQLIQFADIKVGMFFYESWGYDQTNIDFLEVIEVSPTKKTVMCRMVGKKSVESHQQGDSVAPDNSYRGQTLFRLKVSWFGDGCTLNGSYPLGEHYWSYCKANDNNISICPESDDTQPYHLWNEDKKSVHCEGCKNHYKKLSVSYRSGSFSEYKHPMYETDSMYGH